MLGVAAGAGHELPDPRAGVGQAVRRLGREALVLVGMAVVAHGGMGLGLVRAPGWPVAVVVVARRALLVGVVAERDDRVARALPEQCSRRAVAGLVAARDVARSEDHARRREAPRCAHA